MVSIQARAVHRRVRHVRVVRRHPHRTVLGPMVLVVTMGHVAIMVHVQILVHVAVMAVVAFPVHRVHVQLKPRHVIHCVTA